MNTQNTNSSVVVIGAGFAGLACARTLLSQGGNEFNVTILEASASCGGRARTGKLHSGTMVELGATWFHGVHNNPVYDLAVWQGIVRDVRNDPEHYKHDTNWQLHFARPLEPSLLSGQLNDTAMEAIARYTEVAEECTTNALLGDGSVGDVLRRTYDQAVASEGLSGDRLQAFSSAWLFREKLQRTFDGFYSTDDVSLAFAREYETLEGPNLPVAGGYQALAETLAEGLDIRFNHRVSRIVYGAHGVRVYCTNGAVFDADHVVVTVSLGVLQEYAASLFDPPLPAWKREAMLGIRIGIADKIFVEFEIDPDHTAAAREWLRSHASLPGAALPSPASAATLNAADGGAAGGADAAGKAAAPPSPSPGPSTPHHESSGELSQALMLGSGGGGEPPLTPAMAAAVRNALPPPATHGLPEPWNMGRKAPATDSIKTPGALQVAAAWASAAQEGTSAEYLYSSGSNASLAGPAGHMLAASRPPSDPEVSSAVAAAAAAAATLPAAGSPTTTTTTCSGGTSGPLPTGSAARPSGGRRRQRHQRTIHTYAFLWPVAQPELLGIQGHPAALADAADAAQEAMEERAAGLAVGALLQGQQLHPWPGAGQLPHAQAHFFNHQPPLLMPPAAIAANLPRWALGLHSIRFSPGPEWIQPSLLEQDSASGGQSRHKRPSTMMLDSEQDLQLGDAHGAWSTDSNASAATVAALGGGAGGSRGGRRASGMHISGVLWVTGEAALEMEAATDEEVAQGITSLLGLFPQVPLPPGARLPPRVLRTRWGAEDLFRGSYSYMRAGSGGGPSAAAAQAAASPTAGSASLHHPHPPPHHTNHGSEAAAAVAGGLGGLDSHLHPPGSSGAGPGAGGPCSGEQCTGEAVDVLGEPLHAEDGTPVVLFAGEATHRNYIGTVHGAFLSGCREAERLLMLMNQRMLEAQMLQAAGVHCTL